MQRSPVPWLALLLLVVGAPASWSEDSPIPVKEAPTTVLRGDDVPYAYRASVLLNRIASAHKRQGEDGPSVESLLLTIGLNPSTELAQSLVKLAVSLDQTHPYVVPAQELTVFGKDYDALNAHLEEREDQRLEALGEGLGRWLLDCEAENFPVDPLLDRILNGTHLSTTLFSTHETAAELRTVTRSKLDSFERGLTRSFGRVPSRLEWHP